MRSVNVGAVFDGCDGDLALPIIYAVDQAVVTTASAVQPLEAQLQRIEPAALESETFPRCPRGPVPTLTTRSSSMVL